MEGLGESILDRSAQIRAEQMALLGEQRMLLRGLRDEVQWAIRLLGSSESDPGWQSEAATRFAERYGELQLEVERAERQIDDAIDAVQAEIAERRAEYG